MAGRRQQPASVRIRTTKHRDMKKLLFWAACWLSAIGGAQAQDAALSLKDITDGAYSPTYVYGVRPMADGETYTRLSPDRKRIVRHSFKTGKEVETLFDAATARGPKALSAIDGYILSPDGRRILIQTETRPIYRRSFTAVYYIYDIQNNKMEPLSDGGPQQVPVFSPDGNLIAFVRDNDIYLVKLLFGNAESRVTKDGKRGEVLNGIPDWVNEEEFSLNSTLTFSADSRMLAWVRYDETDVPLYSFPLYRGAAPAMEQYGEYPGAYTYKYPVAGAKNSEVSVLTFDVKNRVTRQLDLPLDKDGYVPRIAFTSEPDQLAVVTLNRRQDQMDIYMANARSTVCKLAVRETADKYVKETAYGSLQFYPGHFAYISDRSGYDHVYLYTLSGQLVRQLTRGNYDVTNFYGYDAKTGRCYYASRQESPLRKAVYVSDKNGKVRKLSDAVGTNDATFSSTFKYYMNVYSSAQQPPVTTLRNAEGRLLTTLVDNKELSTKLQGRLGQKEFFTFKTTDGTELNGWMIKPADFDPSRRYPVIMYQYSGPGSQEVTDSWNMGFFGGGVYESYMASRGYIYVCVDGRGTGGRGSAFQKCTYLHLGRLEAEDQAAAARYLATLPYVDGEHIGIWGWSFGGFNTLMSMSTGQPVFRAGVAVAAPADWRYYDTVYTERYMRTPQENGDGYADNPISRAPQLSGDLLLIHGTADDNVHLRNAMEYSEALVQAGKQFDMQVYTNRNHNIFGGQTRLHLFTRISSFFDAHLKR